MVIARSCACAAFGQSLAAATRELSPAEGKRLIAVCVALMAVIASVTGLNVAQPDVAVEFGAAQTTILWIINVYTLTLAALLLPLGAVGDRWGRKPVLLLGLACVSAIGPWVDRIIGNKRGTGGSAGASSLRSTLDKRLFPELWSLRTDL